MADYRYVLGLLVQGLAYRQIEAMAGVLAPGDRQGAPCAR